MRKLFKINASFEGAIDEDTVEFLRTDDRFSGMEIEHAVAKLFIMEMERNREVFGTHLVGLPEPEELKVTISD